MLLIANLRTHVLADTEHIGQYALPQDKTSMAVCRQAALAEHPGAIQQVEVRNTIDGFRYYFFIRARDRTTWTVNCDGVSRKIIRVQCQE